MEGSSHKKEQPRPEIVKKATNKWTLSRNKIYLTVNPTKLTTCSKLGSELTVMNIMNIDSAGIHETVLGDSDCN